MSQKNKKIVKLKDVRQCSVMDVTVNDVLEAVSEDIEEKMPSKMLCITYDEDEDTYIIYSAGMESGEIVSTLELCKTELIITNYLERNSL